MSDYFYDDAAGLAGIAPPRPLQDLLASAHGSLRADLERLAPALAAELIPWMAGLGPAGAPPQAYFCHPLAFPLLQLPWWLDARLGGQPDPALQSDLLRSSMCGYYLIRLFDDVMDRSPAARPDLLPAAGVYHDAFHTPYARRFPPDDPFWPVFHRAWAEGHEAAVVDGRLTDLDLAAFERVAGRKVCAALIPMHAVARHHGLPGVPEAWCRFFHRYCAWHQLHNDLLDWQRDLERGTVTYFLCEGRRRSAGGSVVAWVLSEGFDLGRSWLDDGLGELRPLAEATGSAPLVAYLDARHQMLERLIVDLRPGLAALRALLGAAGRT